MSHEALNNTKVEYEKQKKDMSDVDSSISRLQDLRDKEQKTLNSKRSRKVELETKLTKNTQDLKKPDADKYLLNQEKTQIENELAEVDKDIPIYTSIVQDYDGKIQKLKKSKDILEPKLSSAKKESMGERVAHFTKNNWKALLASTILMGATATGYEYGKNSSGNDKDHKDDKNKTEQTPLKADTTIKKGNKDTVYYMPTPATSKKDTVYIKTPSKNKDVVNGMKDTTKKGLEAKTGNFVIIDGVKYEKMTQAPNPSDVKPNGDYRKVGGYWYQRVSEKKEVFNEEVVNIDGIKYQKMSQAPDPSLVKPFGDYRKVKGGWYKKSL